MNPRLIIPLSVLIFGVLAISMLTRVVASAGDDTQSLQGQAAPEVDLTTVDGIHVVLSQQKGSVVVMDFWATWCPPCRKSLPGINRLSQDKDRASRGLKVWAVNASETQDKVQQFVTDNKYTFAVPLDLQGTVTNKYLIRGIPTTIVVGRDGRIKNVFIGYGEESEKRLEAAVDEALKESAPST